MLPLALSCTPYTLLPRAYTLLPRAYTLLPRAYTLLPRAYTLPERCQCPSLSFLWRPCLFRSGALASWNEPSCKKLAALVSPFLDLSTAQPHSGPALAPWVEEFLSTPEPDPSTPRKRQKGAKRKRRRQHIRIPNPADSLWAALCACDEGPGDGTEAQRGGWTGGVANTGSMHQWRGWVWAWGASVGACLVRRR